MRKQLTPDQKDLVWAPITSNLGMGWVSPRGRPRDGRAAEVRGGRIRPNLPLDDLIQPPRVR